MLVPPAWKPATPSYAHPFIRSCDSCTNKSPRFANIDVVLITEWLKEPEQTQYFTRWLGLDERALGFNISFDTQKNPRRYDRTWPDGEPRPEDDH